MCKSDNTLNKIGLNEDKDKSNPARVIINQKIHLLNEINIHELLKSSDIKITDDSYTNKILNSIYKSNNTWIAWKELDMQLIGFITVLDDGYNAYINNFIVGKEVRGQGIGNLLLERCRDNYINHNIHVITKTAHLYFKNHGFDDESHALTSHSTKD